MVSNSAPKEVGGPVHAEAPLILAVDTTSARRSVALARGRRLLGVIGVDAGPTHSWNLHDEIALLLDKCGSRVSEIDVLGVAIGPGSFTGLRVGLAAMKGFAHTLARPVVGVSSLEAWARGAGVSGRVCACIDAQRGELYAQVFDVDVAGAVLPVTGPRLIPPHEVCRWLSDQSTLFFAGDGVGPSRAQWEAWGREQGREIRFVTIPPTHPRGWIAIEAMEFLAPAVVWLAEREFREGRAQTAATLDALYVRASDAEMKRRPG